MTEPERKLCTSTSAFSSRRWTTLNPSGFLRLRTTLFLERLRLAKGRLCSFTHGPKARARFSARSLYLDDFGTVLGQNLGWRLGRK